ncbi:MAG: hypothetical protein ACYCR4_09755 [Acidimicrobiales bacterium]
MAEFTTDSERFAEFDVFTTRGHAARVVATDLEHARRLFLGHEWPPGIPPAPRPANVKVPGRAGMTEASPEWRAWYREEFLPRRAAYPVLDSARGECLLAIAAAGERPCLGQYDATAERQVACSICAPAEAVDGSGLRR